jgi:hypothetical protein
MTATRYMDNHAAVLPHRATGYGPADAGFRVAMSNWEQLRDGAVQTSLDDLGKWDANFYSATVGGHALVNALTTVHRLTSGAPENVWARTGRRGPGAWHAVRAPEVTRYQIPGSTRHRTRC